jgi:3-oxoacyl-[acyl-carrier protein] reductase
MSQSVAIVTGANRGIGRATAIRLARDFSAVVIVARTAQTLEDTTAKLWAEGAEPLARARSAGARFRRRGGKANA